MTRRGPKTENGRKAVRQNARTHGIFSDLIVIAGQETQEEWSSHLEGVRASYDPQTYLELLLVERIAHYFWKLRRVGRFEQGIFSLSTQGLSVRGPMLLEEVVIEDNRAIEVKRLLPEDDSLAKVIRYETHLHRQLLQTMHELEGLQNRRRGKAAPLTRLDVTLSPLNDPT